MLKQLYDRMVYEIYRILRRGEDEMCDELLGKGTKDAIDAENYERNKRVEDYRELCAATLPCVQCGSAPEDTTDAKGQTVLRCVRCSTDGFVVGKDEEEARDKWNKYMQREKKKGLLLRNTGEDAAHPATWHLGYVCPDCGERYSHDACVEDEEGNHYCPTCRVVPEPPRDEQAYAEAFMDGIRGDLMDKISEEECDAVQEEVAASFKENRENCTKAAKPIVWECPYCCTVYREGEEQYDEHGYYCCSQCYRNVGYGADTPAAKPIVWECPQCHKVLREGTEHTDGQGCYYCPACRSTRKAVEEETTSTRAIGECPFCGGFVDLYIAQEDGRAIPRLRCRACPAHTQDLTSVHDLDTGTVMVRLAKTPVWLEGEEEDE